MPPKKELVNTQLLISRAATKSGIRRIYIDEGVKPFIECLREALQNGETVFLTSIGKFEVTIKPAAYREVPDITDLKKGGTPRIRIKSKEKRVVKFTPAKPIK